MKDDFELVAGWIGNSLVPIARFAAQARERFVSGERYIVTVQDQRDWVGHRAYMAQINQLFKNWPESERQFDSATALRKWALIRCGFRSERRFVAANKAEAQRLARFLSAGEPYVEFSLVDNIVIEWRALSQDAHSMGAKEFAKSKTDVIEFLCQIVGVTPDDLRAEYDRKKSAAPPFAADAGAIAPAEAGEQGSPINAPRQDGDAEDRS